MSMMSDKAVHVERAKNALLKAAASLAEWPFERDALAYATLMGAVGMLELAKADSDFSALDKVERYLKSAIEQRTEEG